MLAPLESFVPLESANSPPPASNQPAKSQQLAPFLTKTLEMLENADNAGSIESGYIHWAEDGQSIFVEKPEQFAAVSSSIDLRPFRVPGWLLWRAAVTRAALTSIDLHPAHLCSSSSPNTTSIRTLAHSCVSCTFMAFGR